MKLRALYLLTSPALGAILSFYKPYQKKEKKRNPQDEAVLRVFFSIFKFPMQKRRENTDKCAW